MFGTRQAATRPVLIDVVRAGSTDDSQSERRTERAKAERPPQQPGTAWRYVTSSSVTSRSGSSSVRFPRSHQTWTWYICWWCYRTQQSPGWSTHTQTSSFYQQNSAQTPDTVPDWGDNNNIVAKKFRLRISQQVSSSHHQLQSLQFVNFRCCQEELVEDSLDSSHRGPSSSSSAWLMCPEAAPHWAGNQGCRSQQPN